MEAMALDRARWKGKRVLVTGHSGFKGTWLSLWLEQLGAYVTGLSLPSPKGQCLFDLAGPWTALVDSRAGDVRDLSELRRLVREVRPEIVFHLAAQALVRRGYGDPVTTFETNVLGTVMLLEALRASTGLRSVVVVTTDKVYANDGHGRVFTEEARLGGTEPYGASKAAAEHVVSAYRSFFEDQAVGIGTARAGNAVGGGDFGEDRLFPDIFRALVNDEIIPIRNPTSSRPWQFVLDPLHGYLLFAERLAAEPRGAAPALNFGPTGPAATVAELVDRVITRWGKGSWCHAETHGGAEAAALALDSTLAARTLGWRAMVSVNEMIDQSVEWWRAHVSGDPVRSTMIDQIQSFEARVRQ